MNDKNGTKSATVMIVIVLSIAAYLIIISATGKNAVRIVCIKAAESAPSAPQLPLCTKL